MKLVWDQPEMFVNWASRQLGFNTNRFWPPYTAIGTTTDDGIPTACGILNCFNGIDIELTVVGKGKFTRTLWRALLGYGWYQLGLKRVTMRMRESNTSALKLGLHFGARVEGRLRKYYGDEDAIVLGLLREECRYVKSFQSS